MYSISQKIGVNAMINSTANNWNQKDELRAFESLITQISTANRSKNITIAVRNRKELCKIVLKIHSDEVKGFQITSAMSQLHSIIFIAACANSPVSIISQKKYKMFFNTQNEITIFIYKCKRQRYFVNEYFLTK
jgi:hypothetical protein